MSDSNSFVAITQERASLKKPMARAKRMVR